MIALSVLRMIFQMTNSEFPKPAKRATAYVLISSLKTSAWLIFASWVSIAGAHIKAYGLGWRRADVRGFNEVSHTGTIDGMYSYVVMIPELELGVVFLTNGSSPAARSSVMKISMPARGKKWRRQT
jgi:CubicO group peptidase (beta-lactamase class C family)